MTNVEVTVMDINGEPLDRLLFGSLSAAVKFLQKHKSTTFGCYMYSFLIYDVVPNDVN